MRNKSVIFTTIILVFFSATSFAQSQTELIDFRDQFSPYVPRVESLTYVDSDDSLWQVHDAPKNATARATAGQDPNSSTRPKPPTTQTMDQVFYRGFFNGRRSTTENSTQLETIAYDSGNDVLYVVNTINSAKDCPPVDVPTIFKLKRSPSSGRFRVNDWHVLPSASKNCPTTGKFQSSYAAMVVISGSIYFAHNRKIRKYDYNGRAFFTGKQNQISLTQIRTGLGFKLPKIRDMAYDGTHLWTRRNRSL